MSIARRMPRVLRARRATFLLSLVGFAVFLFVLGFLVFTSSKVKIERSAYIGQMQLEVLAAAMRADADILYAATALGHAAAQAGARLAAASGLYHAGEEADLDEAYECGTFLEPQWASVEKLCLPDARANYLRYTQDALDEYLTGLADPYPASQYVFSLRDADGGLRVEATATQTLKIPIAKSKAGLPPVLGGGAPVQYGDLRWPTDTNQISVTSCFGPRQLGASGFHYGLDSGLPDGTPILAAGNGIVVKTCEQWVGPCQCSSLRRNCPAHCLTQPPMCGNYGNYVLIKHNDALYTQYNHLSAIPDEITEGATVAAGTLIGSSGSTGRSTGGHLDLKVFDSAAGNFASNTAKNPVCFFGRDVLERMGVAGDNNCQANYGRDPFRLDNPRVARDCAAVNLASRLPPPEAPPGDEAPPGGETPPEGPPPPAEGLNPEWARAVEQWDPHIRAAADKYTIPPGLIKAMMYHESQGDPTKISVSGAVGLGQFIPSTARGYAPIFRRVTPCCTREGDEDIYTICHAERRRCGSDTWCATGGYACSAANDDRFDPERSIEAMAKYLSESYERYDRNLFLIAISYNAGPGIANRVRDNPSCRPPAIANLRACLQAAYARSDLTEEQRRRRVAEAFTHAVKVAEAFAAFGGGYTVSVQGETGYYAIWPHLLAPANAPLAEFDELKAWVQETWEACQEAEDQPACVAEKLEAHNADEASLTALALGGCEEAAFGPFFDFAGFLERCRISRLADCACAWTPPAASALPVTPYKLDIAFLPQEDALVGHVDPDTARLPDERLPLAFDPGFAETDADAPEAASKLVYHVGVFENGVTHKGLDRFSGESGLAAGDTWWNYDFTLLRRPGEVYVAIYDAADTRPCPLPRLQYRLCARTKAAYPLLTHEGSQIRLSRGPLSMPITFTVPDTVAPRVPDAGAYHWRLPGVPPIPPIPGMGSPTDRWGLVFAPSASPDIYKYTAGWADLFEGASRTPTDLYPTTLEEFAPGDLGLGCAPGTDPPTLGLEDLWRLEPGTAYRVVRPNCPDRFYLLLDESVTAFTLGAEDQAGNAAPAQMIPVQETAVPGLPQPN